MSKLDSLLEYLEDKIDVLHEEEKEKLQIDALNFKEVPYLPISIKYPIDSNLKRYPYHEAFNDPEKMLYNELVEGFISVYNSVILQDYTPLHIRSNHGIGLIPSLFGCEIKLVGDNMPWVEPLGSIEKIKQLISKGVPQFDSPLWKNEMENYQFFNNKLSQYPKCYKTIKITQPDLEGPFDIIHMIVGVKLFTELYDNPDIIHQLLELITITYIEFKKYIENSEILTDKAGEDAVYVHGAISKGNVIIKDDTAMVSLSENMYQEFAGQYNEKILNAFHGRGSIHYCGPPKDWHYQNIIKQGFSSINFGNPEMHNIVDLYNSFGKNDISIISWGRENPYSFLDDLYKENIDSGISLLIKADSYKEAKKILIKHKKRNN